MRSSVYFGVLTVLLGSVAAHAENQTVTNIKAEFADGQVFVTWTESAANTKNLNVYISDCPIKDPNSKTKLIAHHVEPHSAADWMEDSAKCPRSSNRKGGWIIGKGQQLNPVDGFFVHTVTKSDPEKLYIAVLSEEDEIALGQNSLEKPVCVKVQSTTAFWQKPGPEINIKAGMPLVLLLHAKTGRPKDLNYLVFGDSTMGWREGLPFKFGISIVGNAVVLEPYDRMWINRCLTESWDKRDHAYPATETMWYGTNNKIYDVSLKETGTPYNYSENRILWIIDWVQNRFKTDPDRVYAFGTSMGTAALRLGCLHPDRFAALDLRVPIFDGSYRNGKEDLARRYEPVCGPISLICNDGISLADRVNMTKFISKTNSDLPFITIRAGRRDTAVYWSPCTAFIETVQNQRLGLLAGWDNGDHLTAMSRKMPAGFPSMSDYDWYFNHFAIKKSYPAFTNFSLNSNPGNGDPNNGDISGGINIGLDWDNIADSSQRYEILLKYTLPITGKAVAVDITPRRLQNFKPAPRSSVLACNYDGNKIVQRKHVIVDEHGLITFKQFKVTSPKGNRLIYALPKAGDAN